MNLVSLAAVGAVALLSITDPTGDAHGDGTLTPPTSPIYAHSAIFDLQELDLSTTQVGTADGVVVREPATVLSVTLGAVDPDDAAPAGFSGVVIDVYLDFVAGGSETTLVGPGMLLPLGSGWDYAVRLSPAGAFGVAYHQTEDTSAVTPPDEDVGAAEDETPAVDSTEPEDGPTSAANGDPGVVNVGDLELQPLALRIEGNRLVVELPLELTEDAKVYAVTGVYDPFASTGWRPLATTTSPWAYSGGEQVVPVIDVLAVDQASQTKALQTGALPQQLATADRGIVWLVLMGIGLLLAITGLWFRRRVVPEARSGLPYGLPPDPEAVDEPVASGAKPDSPNPESPGLVLGQSEQQEPEQDQAQELLQDEQQEPEQDQAQELVQDERQEPEQDLAQNDQRDAFAMFGVQSSEDDEEEEYDGDDFLDGVPKRPEDA